MIRNTLALTGMAILIWTCGVWANESDKPAASGTTAASQPAPAQKPAASEKPAPKETEAASEQNETLKDRGRDTRTLAQKMAIVIDPVKIDGISARNTLSWWSTATGMSMVINWDSLSQEGIDPDKKINLELRNIAAGKLLSLLLTQIQTNEQPLMVEKNGNFIEIITKSQANKRMITLAYDVRDLIMDIPNFEPTTSFDLGQVLSQSNAGYGGYRYGGGYGGYGGYGGGYGSGYGRGSSSLFPSQTNTSATPQTPVKTAAEKGEEIAQLIRDVIETTIWKENGGEATIRFYNGMLIVNAPRYVHEQIGDPVPTPKR